MCLFLNFDIFLNSFVKIFSVLCKLYSRTLLVYYIILTYWKCGSTIFKLFYTIYLCNDLITSLSTLNFYFE